MADIVDSAGAKRRQASQRNITCCPKIGAAIYPYFRMSVRNRRAGAISPPTPPNPQIILYNYKYLYYTTNAKVKPPYKKSVCRVGIFQSVGRITPIQLDHLVSKELLIECSHNAQSILLVRIRSVLPLTTSRLFAGWNGGIEREVEKDIL